MKWIYAILIFSVLVLFHEFGHFLFAKLNGVEVEEFSFGFGPRLLSTVHNGTRYSLKLLWFGGSCLMKGMYEEGEEDEFYTEDGREMSFREAVGLLAEKERTPEPGSFNSVSIGRRAAIIFAGPLFNFLLAFFCAVIVTGTVGYDPAVITSVEEGSPAAEAGLKAGDVVTSFMGSTIRVGRELSDWNTFHSLQENETVSMKVQRDGETLDLSFTPEVITYMRIGITYQPDDGQAYVLSVVEQSPLAEAGIKAGDVITAIDGTEIASGQAMSEYFSAHPLTDAPVTISFLRNGTVSEAEVTPVAQTSIHLGYTYNGTNTREKTSAINVIKYSFIEIDYWIRLVLNSLKGMFTGLFTVDDLSGPVGIVDTVGQTYESVKDDGTLLILMNMLYLVIMLSANLGVMNLLPIPALDGGRLLFLLIEAVRGKPMNKRAEMITQVITVVLLLTLMIYVMFHDISRLL
ncbi:MAG: site-2 protease family protein [Lachnospiraceae bacterium]|nr:site-2 protease family protein [Lachnospiraceae bacterium]